MWRPAKPWAHLSGCFRRGIRESFKEKQIGTWLNKHAMNAITKHGRGEAVAVNGAVVEMRQCWHLPLDLHSND